MKIMAFSPTATFGQLFPFQTSFEAKLFSSPQTVDVWLTRQQTLKFHFTFKLVLKSQFTISGSL